VMYLLDTRLSEPQGRKAIKAMRELLPHGTFIRQSPIGVDLTPRDNGTRSHWPKGTPKPPITGQGGRPGATTPLCSKIGGMLLIVSNKWSKHIKEWWKDPSGYGVVSSVTIQGMSQVITIFGTYWPFQREGSDQSEGRGSLWSLLQDNYLNPQDIPGTPRDYVEHQINQQLTRRMGKPHHSSLLIGDLNGRLAKTDPGSGPVILDNICSKGWIPFLSTAPKGTRLYPVHTFWRGKGRRTCPDHALPHRNLEDLLQASGD